MSLKLTKVCDYCNKNIENKTDIYLIERLNPTHLTWSEGLDKHFCEYSCLTNYVINNPRGF